MSIIHLEIQVDTSRELLFPAIMLGQCFVFTDDYTASFNTSDPIGFYRTTMCRKTGANMYYKLAGGYRPLPTTFFHVKAFHLYRVILSTNKHHQIQRELDTFRSLPQPEPGSLVLGGKHKNA